MDTDLVVRAQRGDKEAYAILATIIANRFLAVARRILRDRDVRPASSCPALLEQVIETGTQTVVGPNGLQPIEGTVAFGP